MKLRVIKKTRVKESGEVLYRFVIQKKHRIFGWQDYEIPLHNFTTENKGSSEPNGAAYLKLVVLFESEERANKILNKIAEDFTEVYKGNVLTRIYDINTLEDFFINKSKFRIVYGCTLYDYSRTLEGLKRTIDGELDAVNKYNYI